MRATRLFTIYAVTALALTIGFSAVTLSHIQRSTWWDDRKDLAYRSYWLHLELEALVFQLFKQHGDALLIGDRDRGSGEIDLRERITATLGRIRDVIAREIRLVGEEEIEELAKLDEIEDDIRNITNALATLSAAGEPLETTVKIERLAGLLDKDIDVNLARLIDAALAEELAEVDAVVASADAFRANSVMVIVAFAGLALALLIAAILSFNRQIRRPLVALRDGITVLQRSDYDAPIVLGGSTEFVELERVLGDMAGALARREATRGEQKAELERQIADRTAELQRMIRQIEGNEANRKRLMADISHELRTPLAIILGEAEVALRTGGQISDQISDALSRIREAAKHTNQVVEDMLTIARHESGQLRLNRRDGDLRTVLTKAAELFPHKVSLEMPDAPVPAHVDAVRLRQSILAVLLNARRYGGPQIRARIEALDGSVRIVVKDDGPGMSDAEKAQAFERFFRGSNAAGQASEGSGLGLPIVKSILEAHGGTVRLEDVDSGGLRVILDLPQGPRIAVVNGTDDAVDRRRSV